MIQKMMSKTIVKEDDSKKMIAEMTLISDQRQEKRIIPTETTQTKTTQIKIMQTKTAQTRTMQADINNGENAGNNITDTDEQTNVSGSTSRQCNK